MKHPWQRFEQRVADTFATNRNAFSGSNGGVSASDSYHDRIFIECKYHAKDTESLKLMKETEIKAKAENKMPILALGNPDDPKKNIYVMFNAKDLLNVLKEIDLSDLDKMIPEGTTVHKLLSTASSNNMNLFELKEQLTIDLKSIMRDKVISGDALENVKSIGAMLYMIDTIIDYSRDDNGN